MAFVQVVEFTTSRGDEIRALVNDYRESSQGERTSARATVCQDREDPTRFAVIVRFPSYEEAMENSARPETAAMAEAMAKLCDGPPTFRNLDVIEEIDD